jgi:hypothetical protein
VRNEKGSRMKFYVTTDFRRAMMPAPLRETSEGGLAQTPTAKAVLKHLETLQSIPLTHAGKTKV